MKNKKRDIINKILVNSITGIRSLGSIAIVAIYLSKGSFLTAIFTIIFFMTDCIDGFLARRLHAQTFFGSLLDGMSDKAFGIICLIILSTLNPVFLSLILIEITILYVNYQSVKRGNNTQSSIAGKAKTLLLAATIVGSFFCYAAPNLKEILDYLNISSFNRLLETNPDILSTILAIPAIGTGLFVISDYIKKAERQDERREKELEQEVLANLSKTKEEITIEKIEEEKKRLQKEKEQIESAKKYITGKELCHALFDTEFFLEHKNDSIKKLLRR